MPILGARQAPPRVAEGVSIGFGVRISLFLGVTPKKSEECNFGFSPSNNGVETHSHNLARFSASIIIASPLPAGFFVEFVKGSFPAVVSGYNLLEEHASHHSLQ